MMGDRHAWRPHLSFKSMSAASSFIAINIPSHSARLRCACRILLTSHLHLDTSRSLGVKGGNSLALKRGVLNRTGISSAPSQVFLVFCICDQDVPLADIGAWPCPTPLATGDSYGDVKLLNDSTKDDPFPSSGRVLPEKAAKDFAAFCDTMSLELGNLKLSGKEPTPLSACRVTCSPLHTSAPLALERDSSRTVAPESLIFPASSFLGRPLSELCCAIIVDSTLLPRARAESSGIALEAS